MLDTSFEEMTKELLSPLSTAPSAKTTHPPWAPEAKTKSQSTSSSGWTGALCAYNRKCRYVSSFSNDLSKGDLYPITNKKVLHLTCYVYYSTENTILENAMDNEKLRLNEHYS